MTGSGRQAKDCYWEIGLPSAAMALVVVGPATGQALLSECSNNIYVQFASAFLSLETFNTMCDGPFFLGTW